MSVMLPALLALTQAVEIDEVIVTARRRSERVGDAAAAVSVFDRGQVEAARARDVGGLVGLAPGLAVVDGGPSNQRLILRGVQGVGEGTVGLYYDDVAVTGAIGAANDAGGSVPGLLLVDVDRVEILRGPQGTLYGANAMVGAVKVRFNAPTFEAGGELIAEGLARDGGEPGWRASAMINAPLVSDRLAARAVYYREAGGGWIDGIGDDVNSADREGGRLALRWRPRTGLTVDLRAALETNRGDQPGWVLEAGDYRSDTPSRRINDDQIALFAVDLDWDLGAVGLQATAASVRRDLRQFNTDPSAFFGSLVGSPGACARFFGGGAPCPAPTQAAFDAYAASFSPNAIVPDQSVDIDSIEARLSSREGASLRWTAGVYASRRRSDIDNLQLDVDPATGLPRADAVRFHRQVGEGLDQAAIFADLSYPLSPTLTLEAGARRFSYRRQASGSTPVGLDLIGAAPAPFSATSSREDGWTGRGALVWRPRPRWLAYASVATGYRPGGVNQTPALPSELAPYGADELVSYEVGVKHSGAGYALEVAAYRIDWRDMQVAGSRPDGLFRFTSNAGEARIDGIEATAALWPADGWTLRASASFSDARLVEDQVNALVVAAGRRGDRIPYAPRFTAGLLAEHRRPLGSTGLEAVLTASVRHVSDSYSEFRPTNPFYRRLPDYTLVNASVAVAGDRWEAGLYLDNAFDEVALTAATANPATLGRTQVVAAPPRTLALRLSRRF